VADQSRQLVLQVEAAQEVWLLAGKELDQEIYIAVFAPVTEDRAKNPQCFHRGTAAEVNNFVDRKPFAEKLI
jgi:hypothetical protein